MDPTLCFPDNQKSCFACCPPIRPPGYEHIQYSHIIKRMLRENTADYDSMHPVRPIIGYSCWGLGYLDPDYRLVGCLLHPAQNQGRDLRYKVNYRDKCQRESCPDSKIFMELDVLSRKFWLNLSNGLDSFAYSSRSKNILFNLMGWGSEILHLIASQEKDVFFTRQLFLKTYPFFKIPLNPKANAYLLQQSINKNNLDLLKYKSFGDHFLTFATRLTEKLKNRRQIKSKDAPFTHLLELDLKWLDFLRLALGIRKIHKVEALELQKEVARAIDHFQTITI